MPDTRELIELSKDLPQVGVMAITLFGVNLQAWVLILTAAWAVFRLGIAALDFLEKLEKRWNRKDSNEQST